MIMCKIDDFIDVTSRYIAELLDLRADIRPVEKDVLHTFPANITAGYTFCTANLLGHDVVLLYSADSSAYTPWGRCGNKRNWLSEKPNAR